MGEGSATVGRWHWLHGVLLWGVGADVVDGLGWGDPFLRTALYPKGQTVSVNRLFGD